MRDIFQEIFENQPLDPVEAARRSVRVSLRKRFYETASAADDGAVTLDGKPVLTPKRRALKAPNLAIARAIAAEWEAQRDTIDPLAMPLTRLANSIIDGVADAAAAVRGEIERYLGSDLVFYRADSPDGLIARQAELWTPLMDFARNELGARFVLAQGVMHVTQSREAVDAAAQAIPSGTNPEGSWRLGAVAAITTLTGSALIALALAAGRLTGEAAWAAAHVDEDWNMAAWGRDEAVVTRRAAQFAELDAAVTVLRHTAAR